MELYDLKICKNNGQGKKFWKTIGTVFANNPRVIDYDEGKPPSFVIDFPECSGILVRREKKQTPPENPEQ